MITTCISEVGWTGFFYWGAIWVMRSKGVDKSIPSGGRGSMKIPPLLDEGVDEKMSEGPLMIGLIVNMIQKLQYSG